MASPLTVLHIDIEKGWRGGQQQVAYLIGHLETMGLPPWLACRPAEALHRHAAARGWSVAAVGRAWPLAIPALLRRIREADVTLLHAHSSRSQNVGLALKSVCPRLRLVVSRRVALPRHGGPLAAWKYKTALVDRWIAVSEPVREILIRDGVDEGRICVIHSGVDVGKFRTPPDVQACVARCREALGLQAGQVVLGNVGALTPQKDQRTLILAYAAVARDYPRSILLVAGEGKERAPLEALIREHGLARQVRLLGQREDVPYLLRLMDLFVLSSRMEGLSNTVLEAMSAGVPVVMTDAAGLPVGSIHRRTALVVPSRNPEAMAATIREMLDAPSLRAELAARARAETDQFDARRTAERTLALYTQLIEGEARAFPSTRGETARN